MSGGGWLIFWSWAAVSVPAVVEYMRGAKEKNADVWEAGRDEDGNPHRNRRRKRRRGGGDGCGGGGGCSSGCGGGGCGGGCGGGG